MKKLVHYLESAAKKSGDFSADAFEMEILRHYEVRAVFRMLNELAEEIDKLKKFKESVEEMPEYQNRI